MPPRRIDPDEQLPDIDPNNPGQLATPPGEVPSLTPILPQDMPPLSGVMLNTMIETMQAMQAQMHTQQIKQNDLTEGAKSNLARATVFKAHLPSLDYDEHPENLEIFMQEFDDRLGGIEGGSTLVKLIDQELGRKAKTMSYPSYLICKNLIDDESHPTLIEDKTDYGNTPRSGTDTAIQELPRPIKAKKELKLNELNAIEKQLDEHMFNQLRAQISGTVKSLLTHKSYVTSMVILGTTARMNRLTDIKRTWSNFKSIQYQGNPTVWYTLVSQAWNTFATRKMEKEHLFLLQIEESIGHLSENISRTLTDIIEKHHRDDEPINVPNALMQLSKYLNVSDSTGVPRANRAAGQDRRQATDTRPMCEHCDKRHNGECWKMMTCTKCLKTGHIARYCRSDTDNDSIKGKTARARNSRSQKSVVSTEDESSDEEDDYGSEGPGDYQ